MTAPKKYLNVDRTVVNPEWIKWREEARALAAEADDAFLNQPGQRAMYFPETEGKAIPEDGAWILILEEPPTELRSRFRLPILSMWRARPHTLNMGATIVRTESGAKVKAYPQQAVIVTPGGDLHLWPHEYVIASDPLELLSDPDATIHSLGGDAVLDPEQLFYLQSRGIPHQDAVLLLFEQIQGQDFAYVTFPDDVVGALRGVGTPLWKHVHDNPWRIA